MTDNEQAHRTVVVGVDGSTQSGEALRWAAEYATRLGSALRAVIVWEHSPGFGYFPGGAESFEHEARHTLERTVDKVLGDDRPPNLELRVVAGNPKSVLLDESRDADLLVVGDRGYGGFVGLLLGSVGEACARHSKCSVVVVRDPSAKA